MWLTSIDLIEIPKNRQRKQFNEKSIATLADSIESKGLMHPIVLRKVDSQGLALVAGHRRLLACKLLHEQERTFQCDGGDVALGSVPYLYLSDLSDVLIREAELEENIVREDLTWQERTAALAELHSLRQIQNPEQTTRDTAREIAGETGSIYGGEKAIAKAEVVNKLLDRKEVSSARNVTEAYNIASRIIEAEFLEELEERGVTKPLHVLIHGDLIEYMSKLEPNFDLIIADPPYGIGADQFGDAAKLSHGYEDSQVQALLLARAILDLGSQLTEDEAHLYMFCDIENFVLLREMVVDAGWKPSRTPLIWSKGTTGHAPSRAMGFRRQYELILFATKGDKPLATVRGDVFDFPNPRDKVYAAQKPVELYEAFMRLSCIPGDKVLDPCCGAGTVFRAATACNLLATGIDNDEQAIRLSRLAISGEEI